MRVPVFICLCLIWMGCPSSQRKPANFDEDPSDVLNSLKACESKMFSTSGVLHTDTWKDGKRVKLEQLFIRSKEGNLRIDTLSPVGQPLSTLVYDGGRLLVYDQGAGIFYIGSASKEVIRNFLLVNIEPKALSTILGGCVPFIDGKPSKVSWDSASGRRTVMLKDQSRDVQLWYESPNQVRRLELNTSGQHYTLLLGNYTQVEGLSRPTRMKFIETASQFEIDLNVQEIRKMEAIAPETFNLQPPSGVEIRTL